MNKVTVEVKKKYNMFELNSLDELIRLYCSFTDRGSIFFYEKDSNESYYFIFTEEQELFYVKTTDRKPETNFIKYHVLEDQWEFVDLLHSKGQAVI